MLSSVILNGKPYTCVLCSPHKFFDEILKKYNTCCPVWSGKKIFAEKLQLLEEYLRDTECTQHIVTDKDCVICGKKNITNCTFVHKNVMWTDGLIHYVSSHNVKPPSKFIRFVLNNDPTNINKCKNSVVTLKGKTYNFSEFKYMKIRANQLMILDALMEHGGISQKYKQKHETGFRYSEHGGMLEFDDARLIRVIISGTSHRTASNDPDIYFPLLGDASYNHEYIFHTHPPTPTPGGRVNDGILYEFPSVNDIYHFIEHFNKGFVQGSIIVAPEGLYNIRKNTFNKEKIRNNKNIRIQLTKLLADIQDDAIEKYGFHFDDEYFYSIIAQDSTYIDKCNKLLKKYDLHIDYYPRQKAKNNKWILGTIYLPLCHVKKL